jgi:hypothetical protein
MAAWDRLGEQRQPDATLIQVSDSAKARLRHLGWTEAQIEATLRKPERHRLVMRQRDG